ncbi:MAG TPA: SDR family oxidoreductase [Bacteroidota bacterium]|nr:SDR family oxidoreductase [Bacteroidota bacterium]
MEDLTNKIVCITGASSGIGEACATEFAKLGCSLILSARRLDRVERVADTLRQTRGVRILTGRLDVRDPDAVERFFRDLPPDWKAIDILVNNAGLSRGMDKLHEGLRSDWEEMIDTNVKGLLYVSRAVVPGMVERNRGHIVNIGSIAGHQVYPGGNVYCASKHAVKALTEGLKMDLQGTAVRVSSIDPGLVETEFSVVRFHGDEKRAAKTYESIKPLKGADIAEIAVFCATRPPHVNILETIVLPTAQASVHHVHRAEH